MAAENSALHYGNKLHFNIYENIIQLFYIVILFHYFQYFLSNKCSIAKHKTSLNNIFIYCACVFKGIQKHIKETANGQF